MNEYAETRLTAALLALGHRVERLFYAGRDETYFIYSMRGTDEVGHADDEAAGDEISFAVDLYTKTNYTALLREVKKALRAADFYGFKVVAEVREQDTGYYHVSMTVNYLEV